MILIFEMMGKVLRKRNFRYENDEGKKYEDEIISKNDGSCLIMCYF